MVSLAQPQSEARARWVASRVAYYGPGLIERLRLRMALANAICGLLPDIDSGAIRSRIYGLVGLRIDPAAFVMGNLRLTGGSGPDFYQRLSVGAGSVIGDRVTINLDAPVSLGRNVSIGPHVLIYTGTHQVGYGSNRRRGELLARPVEIQDGSWVGLRATILPGVTIGHGSVVAAGSVVDQDIAPNSYVQGNPAAVVSTLPWGDR